jgi:hypothetical protein
VGSVILVWPGVEGLEGDGAVHSNAGIGGISARENRVIMALVGQGASRHAGHGLDPTRPEPPTATGQMHAFGHGGEARLVLSGYDEIDRAAGRDHGVGLGVCLQNSTSGLV